MWKRQKDQVIPRAYMYEVFAVMNILAVKRNLSSFPMIMFARSAQHLKANLHSLNLENPRIWLYFKPSGDFLQEIILFSGRKVFFVQPGQ